MTAALKAPRSITSLITTTPPRKRKSRILGVAPQRSTAPAVTHADAIANMDESYLDCRDLGHQWLRAGAKLVEQGKQIAQFFSCHCGAKRERRLSSHGEILWNDTKYPPGYVMPAGTGRMTADDRATVRMRALQSDLGAR